MKKITAVLLCVFVIAFSAAPSFSAYQSEREYFEDGSYIIVSDEFISGTLPDGDGDWDDMIGDEKEQESTESNIGRFLKTVIEFFRKIIALLKNQKTVTETKYISYFGSDGKRLWTATVTAEFTYNGKSSVCDSVKTGYMVFDSDWKFVSRECSKSGNTAVAHFTFKQYKLAVPLKTIEKTITLTCDKDGNIK